MQTKPTILKIQYKKEVHLFRGEPAYDSLKNFIQKSFKKTPAEFQLTYIDEDKDEITVSCTDDLQALLETAKSPKLLITPKIDSDIEQNEAEDSTFEEIQNNQKQQKKIQTNFLRKKSQQQSETLAEREQRLKEAKIRAEMERQSIFTASLEGTPEKEKKMQNNFLRKKSEKQLETLAEREQRLKEEKMQAEIQRESIFQRSLTTNQCSETCKNFLKRKDENTETLEERQKRLKQEKAQRRQERKALLKRENKQFLENCKFDERMSEFMKKAQQELQKNMEKILEFLATDFTYQQPSEEQRLKIEDSSKIFRYSNSIPFLPQGLIKKLMPQIPCAADFEIPQKDNKSTQYFNVDQDNKAVHRHVFCNECKAFPLIGTRYKCLDIPDMDLCSKCITKKQLPFQFKAIEKPQKKRYIGKWLKNNKFEKNDKISTKIVKKSEEDLDLTIVGTKIKDTRPRHKFACNGCRAFPIVGTRYNSISCPEFDLCQICFDKDQHPHDFKILEKPKTRKLKGLKFKLFKRSEKKENLQKPQEGEEEKIIKESIYELIDEFEKKMEETVLEKIAEKTVQTEKIEESVKVLKKEFTQETKQKALLVSEVLGGESRDYLGVCDYLMKSAIDQIIERLLEEPTLVEKYSSY